MGSAKSPPAWHHAFSVNLLHVLGANLKASYRCLFSMLLMDVIQRLNFLCEGFFSFHSRQNSRIICSRILMLETELSSGINVFSILSMFNVNLFSSAKVSIISDCAKYFRKKLSGRNLWLLVATKRVPKCRTFAIANKLQWRVKAAAQHSSNKFGSAFALHFTCSLTTRERGSE